MQGYSKHYKKYGEILRKLINFAKSSLQFGHKIKDSVKSEMKKILGISTIGGMGYLRIP